MKYGCVILSCYKWYYLHLFYKPLLVTSFLPYSSLNFNAVSLIHCYITVDTANSLTQNLRIKKKKVAAKVV